MLLFFAWLTMFHRLFVLAGICANWIEIYWINEASEATRRICRWWWWWWWRRWKELKWNTEGNVQKNENCDFFQIIDCFHLTTYSHKITSASDSLIWLDFMESVQSNLSSAITYCLTNYASSIHTNHTDTLYMRQTDTCEAKTFPFYWFTWCSWSSLSRSPYINIVCMYMHKPNNRCVTAAFIKNTDLN